MADADTSPDRDLSVVVFGASGIAGRNVAPYIAKRVAETGARWAAAGRDASKLDRVLAETGVSAPETILADAHDPGALAAMTARTRVVLNLVGPYTLYGEPVVEACVANGAHYIDLTGEMPFARRTIEAFHGRAAAAGVKVVQACGFEALPADLGVLLATETGRERWGEELASADVTVGVRPPPGRVGLGDMVSGGTLQGAAAILDGPDPERTADPAVLIEDPGLAEEVRRRSPIPSAPRFDSEGNVIAPMAPSGFINPAVIHRTAALLADRRGTRLQPFRYREGMAMPGGGVSSLPLRYAVAVLLAANQCGFAALTRARPGVRRPAAKILRRLLPSSGFGPKGSRMEDWSWKLAVDARTDGDHHVRVDLDADGNPGYLSTSRMLGEAGLLLAEQGVTPDVAGCLTPAAALGTARLDRFEHAGLRFSVSS